MAGQRAMTGRPAAPRAGRVAAYPGASAADQALVAALRRGDERAFSELVDRYHGQMLRLAKTFVRDAAVAEEVVQDTWLGVIRGIGRFEGRSSLKTWLFQILTNTAKKRGVRERRCVPFSSLAQAADDDGGLDADRFLPEGHMWAGHWAAAPSSWGAGPQERVLAGEAQGVIAKAIASLPAAQRQVITLRDVNGSPAEEVCELLAISEVNQRVLLHRARTKVRAALDAYLTS